MPPVRLGPETTLRTMMARSSLFKHFSESQLYKLKSTPLRIVDSVGTDEPAEEPFHVVALSKPGLAVIVHIRIFLMRHLSCTFLPLNEVLVDVGPFLRIAASWDLLAVGDRPPSGAPVLGFQLLHLQASVCQTCTTLIKCQCRPC